MSEPVDVPIARHNIGDVVQVRRPDGAAAVGTIAEDFAGYLFTSNVMGRDWAMPRRWAVATNEGTLIFVDDADITEHLSDRTGPSTQ